MKTLRLVTFFWKGTDYTYFKLCGSYCLDSSYLTTVIVRKRPQPTLSVGTCLCSNTSSFTKIGSGWVWSSDFALPIPALRNIVGHFFKHIILDWIVQNPITASPISMCPYLALPSRGSSYFSKT